MAVTGGRTTRQVLEVRATTAPDGAPAVLLQSRDCHFLLTTRDGAQMLAAAVYQLADELWPDDEG